MFFSFSPKSVSDNVFSQVCTCLLFNFSSPFVRSLHVAATTHLFPCIKIFMSKEAYHVHMPCLCFFVFPFAPFADFLFVCLLINLYMFIFGCRLVCLRVHPMFTLLYPTESYVSFTSIDGTKHEIWPEAGEQFYEGDLLPNGIVTTFQLLQSMGNTALFYP